MAKKTEKRKPSSAADQYVIPPAALMQRAWVIQDYFSAEITDVLQSVFLAMVDAFESAHVKMTPAIYEQLLKEQAFKLVVHLGAFGDAPGNEEVRIGNRLLTPEYEKELIATLAGAIKWVGKTTIGKSVTWKTPTPPDIIDEFLKNKKSPRWYKTDLIKKVSGIDDYVCDTTKQFLKRLYREPTTNGQFGINRRTRERLKKLRDVMAEAEPELCGHLTVDSLRWTPE
jgi:hypothetical protein